MFFKHKKFISFLLILCTVFSMCGQALTVFAVESSGLDDENVTTIIPSDNLQDIYFELQAEDVPELIDFNEAKEKGHVQRLREKEPDNNTVIFLNDDNTETMYVFAEPIKYTDELGEVKDKSHNLSLVENNYTMTENDVQVNFPINVSDGISATKGEYTVSMMPVPTISETITTDTTAVLANNKVIYSDVFGTADVLYTPLYSGFKEDIILESYNGVNEFNFFVYTNGLIPIKNENGSVSFFDPDTAESVAEMMQVVCYDANNKFAGGDIVITEIKENDIYALTVIADAAFLADENTAYPVSVDQTLSFSGTTAIEDAVVYSGKPNRNYADYSYNNIGYVDSSYKIGELLVKFPTLEDGIFGNLGSYQINSATLTLYPASGGSGNETIRAYRYNATWDESTITWNGLCFNTPPVLLDTVTVPSNTAVTTFNITQAVKTWADSDLSYISPDCGIFLINTDESDPDKCRDFLSTEYASSHSGTGMPRLEIVYTSITRVYASVPTNTIEIGETITISAYVIIDGVKYYNSGTLLSFYFYDFDSESMSNSLVSPDGSLRLTSNVSGHITGLSTGSAMIVVACNSDPIMIDTVRITVVNKRVRCDDIGPFTIYNNTAIRAVDIDAYTLSNGVKVYDSAGGITYRIQERKGTNLEEVTVDSNGTVRSNGGRCNEFTQGDAVYSAHPTGVVTVRAFLPGSFIDIPVKIVCENFQNQHPGSGQVPEKIFRYIRINYPEYEPSTMNSFDEDTLPGVYGVAYNQIVKYCETDENKEHEQINYNFEEDDISTNVQNRNAFYQLLRTSKVVIIQTHGNTNSFVVNAQTGTDSQKCIVTTEDILNLHQGYFSYCELIICLFCHGADGTYDYNENTDTENDPDNMSIIQAFADRGAKCVIGFNDTTSFAEAKSFTQDFAGKITNSTYHAGEYIPNGGEPGDTSFDGACMTALSGFEGAYGNQLLKSQEEYVTFDGRTLIKNSYKIKTIIQNEQQNIERIDERIVMIEEKEQTP